LEEAGSKVYVSVKGGTELELFDLATRLMVLEAQMATLQESVTANTDSVTDLQTRASSTEEAAGALEDKVDLNTDSAQDIGDRQTGDIKNQLTTLSEADGTVRVFRQKSTHEDAIGSQACSLEALACV
jgi:hypothetical protein